MVNIAEIQDRISDGYARIRAAQNHLNSEALLGLALVVREEFPTATHVRVELDLDNANEYEDFLSFDTLIGPDYPDGIDDLRDSEIGEVLNDLVIMVIADESSTTWKAFLSEPKGLFTALLDLDLILRCDGDVIKVYELWAAGEIEVPNGRYIFAKGAEEYALLASLQKQAA